MKSIGFLLALVLSGIGADHAWAQSLLPPRITSIAPSPLSALPGTTIRVLIGGENLADVTSVIVSGQGVSATITGDRSATTLNVTFSIAANAPLGIRTVSLSAPAGTYHCDCLTVRIGGLWYSTNPMRTPRGDKTATVLADGRVLVAGGLIGGTGATTNTEIYDPTSQLWNPTGSMLVPREDHVATLLQNGRVLVTGGFYQSAGVLKSAEIYDPSSGTWTPAAFMDEPRISHAATLLQSGEVLVVGGTGAEIYNPTTNTWRPTGPTVARRASHTATLLPDGTVLVVGGQRDTGASAVGTAEVYSPQSNSWTATASLLAPRRSHTATLLKDGTVLVAGGYIDDYYRSIGTAEVYDPLARQWRAVGDMSKGHQGHSANLLSNGEVLIAGGCCDGMNIDARATPTSELYDPLSQQWSITAPLLFASSEHPSVSLSDGRVMVISGTPQIYDRNATTVNPVPTISGVLPNNVPQGSPDIAITIIGSGFVTDSVARIESIPLATRFVDSETLSAVVRASSLATPGTLTITVVNPSPGGGTSAPAMLNVVSTATTNTPRPTTPPQPIPQVEQGSVQVGYVVITPDTNTAAPLTTLAYGTVLNGVVQDQAGIASFGLTTGATLFADRLNSAGRNIGLAIANPSGITNSIGITLKNEDGTTTGTATINIEPYKQVARFLSELFTAEVLGQSFVGSINIQSGTPFAVLGFPFAGVNFSALPAGNTGTPSAVPLRTLSADAGTIGGANAILLPQFALGGGWATKIALINSSGSTMTGRVDIFDANGDRSGVKLNGATQSTFTYSIPAGGTFVLAPRDLNGQSPL